MGKTKDTRTLHARCNELMGYSGQAGHLLAELSNFWQVAKYRLDNKYWIVGTTGEFEKRFGITRNQYKSALQKLKDAGLVEIRYGSHPYKPAMLRVTWVSIPDHVVKQLGLKSPSPLKTKEVTYKLAVSKPPKKVQNQPTNIYGKEKLPDELQKIESGAESKQELSEDDREKMLEQFEQAWREAYIQHGHGHAQSWKKTEVKKFAMPVMEEAGWKWAKVEKAIDSSFPKAEWERFCTKVQEAKGWTDQIPTKPSIAFVRQVVGLWFDYASDGFDSKYTKFQIKHTDC